MIKAAHGSASATTNGQHWETGRRARRSRRLRQAGPGTGSGSRLTLCYV